MSSSEAYLTIKHVHAAYVKKEILRGVTFCVGRGEIVALLGGNGAGKSTTLKVIAGLLIPTQGRVYMDGKDITRKEVRYRQQQGIGYLLQGGRVFPNLTATENVRLALSYRSASDSEPYGGQLGHIFPELKELANQRAGLLSGGQRQMLAIEMVLTQSPKLVLLDEPTGALAPDLATRILNRVKSFAAQRQCSVVLVEQNVCEAKQTSDRCLRLDEGIVTQMMEGENEA